MDLGIANRVAMVAAASKGLGKASALALAREGCKVSICGRSSGNLQRAKAEIESLVPGAIILTVVADLAAAEDLERWVRETELHLGPVDILVTNSGGPSSGTFLSLDEAKWMASIEGTLMNVVRLCRRLLPGMRERRWGRIVNITSLTAKQPEPVYTISATLRTGLSGLTKVLSKEFAADGITVNAVLPGQIWTDGQEEYAGIRMAQEGIGREEHFERIRRTIPAGFIGEPRDLGAVVAFLCGDVSRYITGISLAVDGGAIQSTF